MIKNSLYSVEFFFQFKGLDPDEGITLYEDTCTKNSLRTMPDKLKEIKVKAEIDICSSLAG